MREVRRLSALRRVAASVVAAGLLATAVWQADDAGWFDAWAVPVADGVARAMLRDVTRWDAATSGERRGVAERVAKGLDGFTLLRVLPFGLDDHRHEIAVYRHEATGLEFSLIPGGTFEMGSPAEEAGHWDCEGPQHTVTLTKAFLLCRTETTQAAWERVMGENPSGVRAPDHPVEEVSWDDGTAFCAKTGLRLPTESEWEWACRAGTTTRYWSGDTEADLARVGWYGSNPDPMHPWMRRVQDWLGKPPPAPGHRPVAAKAANPFGLHDVHGNVWELCADWYDEYPSASATDPTGPQAAEVRVVRGGSWINAATVARSACRNGGTPGSRVSYLGFRPARSVPER